MLKLTEEGEMGSPGMTRQEQGVLDDGKLCHCGEPKAHEEGYYS